MATDRPESRSRSGLPANDEGIATLLMCAWTEYVALYGEPPHGTFKQIHSMLALQSAGRKIAELFARSETGETKACYGKPVAWIREWDGDDSDLGNFVVEWGTEAPADNHEWEPLYAESEGLHECMR